MNTTQIKQTNAKRNQDRALLECEHMSRITVRGETLYTAYRALARQGYVMLMSNRGGIAGGSSARITDKGTAYLRSRGMTTKY
jgi:hypothetical protein